MKVVRTVGKRGVCWKETRDALRRSWGLELSGGGVGSIAGDWGLWK